MIVRKTESCIDRRRVAKARILTARNLASQRMYLPRTVEKALFRSKTNLKKSDLVQFSCIGQQEINLVSDSRPIESDECRGPTPTERFSVESRC